MSFVGNLAKGFIRSAVNQVGRDGGRVVSNKLYGDSHAMPIRGTGTETTRCYEIEEGHEKEHLLKNGYKPAYHIVGNFAFLFYGIILTFFTAGLFGIVPLIRGIHKYSSGKVTYTKKSLVPVYVSDRRYKSGGRFEGVTESEQEIKIDASGEDLKKLRKAAMRDIVFGALGCIIFVFALILTRK